VIHFRRYEEPFLRQAYPDEEEEGGFPLDIVCTHQIMSRLYPGLPRKGLRAVSGFFGYSLPELRRGRQHVKATALIWRHLVGILESEHGLTSFSDLQDWIALPPGTSGESTGKRVYPMDKKLRTGLPEGPGLYRMYRLNGDILYVGKAGSLRRRVNSYFQPQGRHAEHILEMLSQAKDLTFTTTNTALEAALLEPDEIKRLAPPFNRALKEKEREITYASRDLLSFRSHRPDPLHRIGPLAAASHVDPLGPLAGLLSRRDPRTNDGTMKRILGIPGEYLPDRPTFRQGIVELRETYGESMQEGVGLATLMALGARFWLEKLEEKAAEAEAGSGGPADTDPGETESVPEGPEAGPSVWTPERVAKTLKSIIRTGTYQIRRARWLLRLHESSLVWTDRSDPGLKHVAVVESGRARFSGPFPSAAGIPDRDGDVRPLIERQAEFDVATYDRLRVLTTEVRRLCAEGRVVELRLHPAVRLTPPQLRKMLPWV
jgi:DNA polymerase-3 subunit epsilon